MQKDDAIRLRHMLNAAREARSFTQNKTRASLDKNRQLELALVKSIEILGEAATRVTDECRKDLSQIPWANIIGMRNRLIHAYFAINRDILWKTVTDDLPPLITELEKILETK